MRRMTMLMARGFLGRGTGGRSSAPAGSPSSREVVEEETGESFRLLPLLLQIFRQGPGAEGPRPGVRPLLGRRSGRLRRRRRGRRGSRVLRRGRGRGLRGGG